MRKATKAFVIVGILIVFLILSALNMEMRKSDGHITPGPIGTVLMIGMIAAIAAVWKYKPENEKKEDTTADNQTLDKHNPL